MVYQPIVGLGGYAGWLVLQRTETKQREVFESTASLQRDIEYFRENISNATTAKDLVSDRRLLSVALGAFGLSDEIDKRAFIRKILEEGTESDDAFANRLNEPRYLELTEAFGYGNVDNGSNVLLESFREDIIARYEARAFDEAVGEVDNDMRLALNYRREIANVVSEDSTQTTNWFRIMGQTPLREVMETALNLPSEVSQLDIDKQAEIFADAAARIFGSSDPVDLTDSETIDEVLRRFFLVREAENGYNALTPGASALTLLQSSSLGAESTQNLLLSNL